MKGRWYQVVCPYSRRLLSVPSAPAHWSGSSRDRPSLTKWRFSPCSGTTSLTVPRATNSSNSSGSSIPDSLYTACINLYAIPTPARDRNGYRESGLLELMKARAGGRSSHRMVIGDNRVYSKGRRELHLFSVVTPTVHGYEQGHPVLGQRIYGSAVESVSLFDSIPVGNMGNDSCIQSSQPVDYHRRATDSVNVEVAEDPYSLAFPNRTSYSGHCLVHIRQKKGITNLGLVGFQEGKRLAA